MDALSVLAGLAAALWAAEDAADKARTARKRAVTREAERVAHVRLRKYARRIGEPVPERAGAR